MLSLATKLGKEASGSDKSNRALSAYKLNLNSLGTLVYPLIFILFLIACARDLSYCLEV